MGVVYLACDERLGRKVGLKLLPRALVTENTKGRVAGLLGEPRVNVLALNLALDAASK